MRRRNTMSVRKQLGLGFGLLAALVLLVALVAVRALSTTNASIVPILINSKNKWSLAPDIKVCAITKWPELLIGINSVNP